MKANHLGTTFSEPLVAAFRTWLHLGWIPQSARDSPFGFRNKTAYETRFAHRSVRPRFSPGRLDLLVARVQAAQELAQ